jgi:hypothetical protein
LNYKNIWINQLLRTGRKPGVRILGESTHSDCEEQYIKSYKAKGAILLNMTDNGKDLGRGGGHTITLQEIEKIRKSLGLFFTLSLFSEE